jgi:hypothetical protein
MTIAIKAKAVILEPNTGVDVPNGALYINSANNQFTFKSTGGDAQSIAKAGISVFIKKMIASEAIRINIPIAKLVNGKISEAESSGLGMQNMIGYALQEAVHINDIIEVLLVGPNIENAVDGLGFSTGDIIYLSETGGYTNVAPTFGGKTIIKVGIADCLKEIASTTAKDLIIFPSIIIQ